MSKLRIKYKRLKREFEDVSRKTRPVTVTVNEQKVETLGVSKVFQREDLSYLNERRIRNLLVEDMREEIGKYLEVTSQPTVYVPDGVMYTGRLRVVEKED